MSDAVDARLLLNAGISPTIHNRKRALEVVDPDIILASVPLQTLADQLADHQPEKVARGYGLTQGQLLNWLQETTERKQMLARSSNSQSISLLNEAIDTARDMDAENYKHSKAMTDVLIRASAALKPKEDEIDTATTIIWAMPDLGVRQRPSLPDDSIASSAETVSLDEGFERVPPKTGH